MRDADGATALLERRFEETELDDGVGPLSPELVLVDPDLARFAYDEPPGDLEQELAKLEARTRRPEPPVPPPEREEVAVAPPAVEVAEAEPVPPREEVREVPPAAVPEAVAPEPEPVAPAEELEAEGEEAEVVPPRPELRAVAPPKEPVPATPEPEPLAPVQEPASVTPTAEPEPSRLTIEELRALATVEEPPVVPPVHAAAQRLAPLVPVVTIAVLALFVVGTVVLAIGIVARAWGGDGGEVTRVVVPAPRASTPRQGALKATAAPDVTDVAVAGGTGSIRLTWKPPSTPSFDHVDVLRSDGPNAGRRRLVYRGKGTTFTDRAVRNGVEYAYLIVAFDRLGNRSDGVLVAEEAEAPRPKRTERSERTERNERTERTERTEPEARKRPNAAPPVQQAPVASRTLTWKADPRATYYNVQVFRGATKVLDLLATEPRLVVPLRGRVRGRPYTLTPAPYRWYVWPGYGDPAEGRYGKLIKQDMFVVAGQER